jgi:hypothetical protein
VNIINCVIKVHIIDNILSNIFNKIMINFSIFKQLDIKDMPIGYSFKITLHAPGVSIIRETAIIVDKDGQYSVVEVRMRNNKTFTLMVKDNTIESIGIGKY